MTSPTDFQFESGARADLDALPADAPHEPRRRGPVEDETTALDDDGPSDLEMIATDVKQKLGEPVPIKVKGRPGYTAWCRTNVESGEISKWRKIARVKREQIDDVKFAGLILAYTCVAIHKNGKRLLGEDEEPLTFRHPDLLDVLKVRSAADAAKAFFGRDGDLDSAAKTVLAESGWGDDADVVDPT
ncbi:hypothetical protein [Jiangella muralis]|uniref:hypothetical protein n=1 Tax=Jiangella muralis TaxID=702383 RepID=UPI00069FA317|nr:hypothetical protein [Jiangella muralis]